MLAHGFVLSLVGIGGLSSLAAFVVGLRARRLIQKSCGQLAGIRLAWWCIIAGGAGATLLPQLLLKVLRYFNLTS